MQKTCSKANIAEFFKWKYIHRLVDVNRVFVFANFDRVFFPFFFKNYLAMCISYCKISFLRIQHVDFLICHITWRCYCSWNIYCVSYGINFYISCSSRATALWADLLVPLVGADFLLSQYLYNISLSRDYRLFTNFNHFLLIFFLHSLLFMTT